MKNSPYIHPSLTINEAPSDVFMNFDAFRENTETRLHAHEWGQLQVVTGGSLEIIAEETRFIAPPHLAVWVPARAVHYTFNRRPLTYCSINIDSDKSSSMPAHTCLVSVTPIVTAIIEDFRKRSVNVAKTTPDKRLVNVLLDQLYISKEQNHFLPNSHHKMLQPILAALERDPTDSASLKIWASRVHTTERTLARYCQIELGMSFTEWRIRSKYLHSMTLLKSGMSVKEVALTLGYQQASPFIAMFKKYAGETPEQYKNRLI
ncbi:AraC family transcriptional regulator [Vibrio algarum]|uniref:Helix-turn-helix transcriptional regulator n=1 Tax=Vibrio algarum TaxID=3020714 RepID=A0ABT4YYY2_9VIBR|nr:helix-turn-helix transcriptional regulator [Vibrio sp. KJ40-1]MDB1126163.1 helix-turn-helix transcriptional regulator [Vibrio sp. KJ40-1]